MEFLVELEINVPLGTPESEVADRQKAEAVAAAKLVDDGHLVRLWKLPVTYGDPKVLGLYRAESETELDALLSALPLAQWMRITITALAPHPNDPAQGGPVA
ncbi:MAG TPA: muconolactone Delta-isomerase family protein [Acidimicrobiales bacterium]|nr:muconolactone Delta-isomerase family protein [Acidimicrobiales bacterium]